MENSRLEISVKFPKSEFFLHPPPMKNIIPQFPAKALRREKPLHSDMNRHGLFPVVAVSNDLSYYFLQ